MRPSSSSTLQPSGGGTVEWNTDFFEETYVSYAHALYHYDGADAMWSGLTWNRTAMSFPQGFDEANVSQMTFVVMGNSSVTTESGACAKEGCPEPTVACVGAGCKAKTFRWSCDGAPAMDCWNVTCDAAVDVPSTLWT